MKYLQSIIYNLFKILVIAIRFERLTLPLPFPVGGDFQFFDEQSEWNPITCGATL